jgi:hypothetical protein
MIMPGNEVAIAEFLFNNIGKINLKHLDLINEIGAPDKNAKKYKIIRTFDVY